MPSMTITVEVTKVKEIAKLRNFVKAYIDDDKTMKLAIDDGTEILLKDVFTTEDYGDMRLKNVNVGFWWQGPRMSLEVIQAIVEFLATDVDICDADAYEEFMKDDKSYHYKLNENGKMYLKEIR